MKRDIRLLAWIIGVCAAANAALAQASFRGLGFVPGSSSSHPRDTSTNGAVVVGECDVSDGTVPFRWTLTERMQALPLIPDLPRLASAWGVSGVGTVIVGTVAGQGVRWTEEFGLQILVGLRTAHAVSETGSVIVGVGNERPMRWTALHGAVPLGDLPGGAFGGIAYDVSADSQVAVGESAVWLNSVEAFSWRQETLMLGLGRPGGPSSHSRAIAVSRTGEVIVGYLGTDNDESHAFRWVQGSGVELLEEFPAHSLRSRALGVSGDGAVVVGELMDIERAFIWTEHLGLMELDRFLEERGALIPHGWTLTAATGVSEDGRTVVGTGLNPCGQTEGWIARLASPTFPCDADWNADRFIDSRDFFEFLSDFFALDADFNHCDGTTSQDFFDFLAAFFAGC